MLNFEIICPVYNESEGLVNFTEQLKLELSKLNHKYHWRILFIHDPSSPNDKTWETIKTLGQNDYRISGISMWKRFGVQAALWASLKHANGDFVIMMDADGQHPPKVIHDLIKHYESSNSIVLTKRKENFRPNILIFYKLIQMMSEHPSVSSHSDFRLIDRRIISDLLANFDEKKPFIRTLMGYWGDPPVVEYSVNSRISGKSSFNVLRSYNYLVDGILSAGYFPYRYLFPFLMLLPIIQTALAFYHDDWAGALTWTWLTFLALFIGMIAFNIEVILGHTRRRPSSIVKEKINL